jgi:predicted phosphoadenosine phosphosulfate sulfurtransferase
MNVYEATKDRLRHVFNEFDNVYVSFSGGKDSGVLLNLTIDLLREEFPKRKLGVFHIDYEAQYQMTTDYVDEQLSKNLDVLEIYRICLPISAQCSTSMSEHYWIPWDVEKKDLWVRPMPKVSINESNHKFDWFIKGMWDYELQNLFGEWLHETKKAKKTASLIGIRTQESFHRWKAIHAERTADSNYNGLNWSTKVTDNVVNLYPIFDWKVEDIWTANGKFGWDYNKLYDIFYRAGIPLNSMRVASPFNNCAMESLKLYKVIDPRNWGKMIGRVNGVNFAGIYGGTTAMGWKSIKLPPGHTWKSYMEFLLKTLPEEVAGNYRKKLKTSIDYWRNNGGEVSDDTITGLQKNGVGLIKVGDVNPKSKRRKICLEYLDDTDVKEFRLIPTYKRMCICIMKNDHTCKYMGFGLTKHEWTLRRGAERKYKNVLSQKGKSDEPCL